jgi:hypothetical protein
VCSLSGELGNADRAARVEVALADASALIERVTQILAGLDLVRELTGCLSTLATLRDQIRANAAVSEQAKSKLTEMVDRLKQVNLGD